MRRFFSPSADLTVGQPVKLSPELVRHMRSVLRLEPSTEIELLDGQGAVARCTLLELTAKQGTVQVLAVRKEPPQKLQVELIQGIAKGDKLELVLQKGTELGVSHFIICPTERSIGRLSPQRLISRQERWQKIIQEAARQCGQAYLPKLTILGSLNDALLTCCAQHRLLLWETAESSLPGHLRSQNVASFGLLVGPEGGFSAEEAQRAFAAGFKPVKLGPRILRTETAGLAIVSILQYLYGDLASVAGPSAHPPDGKDAL